VIKERGLYGAGKSTELDRGMSKENFAGYSQGRLERFFGLFTEDAQIKKKKREWKSKGNWLTQAVQKMVAERCIVY